MVSAYFPQILGVGLLLTTACGEDPAASCQSFECVPATPGAAVRHDFAAQRGDGAAPGELYAAPFPTENLRREDGGVDLSGFPNPTDTRVVSSLVSILEQDARGFGVSSAIYFSLSEAPEALGDEPVLVSSYAQSVADGAQALLLNVDEDSPGYLEPVPVLAELRRDGGPFGAPNLLSLLPLQGRPLAANARYAAVVLRTAFDPPLGQSQQLVSLLRGIQPPGMSAAAFSAYREGLAATRAAGLDPSELAALTVFETDDPTATLQRAVGSIGAETQLALSTPFESREVFDDFCVYEARLDVPVYQSGTPPYSEVGGGWVLNERGDPLLDHMEEARIVVTLPRAPMPNSGFPVVLFSRTGGGGDRPLVDRGVRGEDGVPLVAGSGPAREFAQVGYAAVSVDGPHGGPRNVTGGDEQFMMFNVGNVPALRDNVRQSALELALVSGLLDRLELDAATCPGADTGSAPARFDPALKVLMGHSMGATIAPLTLATEPSFKAMVLSGAGGSFIENIIHKRSPLNVKIFAEILLGVSGSWSLHSADPAVSLFQWAVEPSDPPAYASHFLTPPAGVAPRHVLMHQGIVDTYILPPIANALSLSAGLDLAGPELDRGHPELADFAPLGDHLPFSGRNLIALPASGNISHSSSQVTAVVLQHPEDGVEDGHEVVFQTQTPKQQYQCFLSTLARGMVPVVPAAGGSCP